MVARSVISLYIYFLAMVIPASARTCQERLDVLEDVVQSLIESQKTKLTDNVDLNQWPEEVLRNPKFEKERHVLEQKLKDFEESLAKANSRIKELETRVADFELSEIFKKTRQSTENSKRSIGREANYVPDQKVEKIKSNTHKMGRSRPGTTAPVVLRNSIQNNPEELQSNVAIAEENLVTLTGFQATKTPSTFSAAFSAYVSVYETDISKGHTIMFDTIVTNFGSHYNQYSGMFTAPEHGVYVFSWILNCDGGGYIFSQLLVNSNVAGAMFTSAEGVGVVRSTTGLVVVQVNAGDVVFVRTHPTMSHQHNLFSHPDWRSSFSGWRLY